MHTFLNYPNFYLYAQLAKSTAQLTLEIITASVYSLEY